METLHSGDQMIPVMVELCLLAVSLKESGTPHIYTFLETSRQALSNAVGLDPRFDLGVEIFKPKFLENISIFSPPGGAMATTFCPVRGLIGPLRCSGGGLCEGSNVPPGGKNVGTNFDPWLCKNSWLFFNVNFIITRGPGGTIDMQNKDENRLKSFWDLGDEILETWGLCAPWRLYVPDFQNFHVS